MELALEKNENRSRSIDLSYSADFLKMQAGRDWKIISFALIAIWKLKSRGGSTRTSPLHLKRKGVAL